MKMKQLEPTYLRYVYDGLDKGSINSNNPTSLPIGFIGLFEDEFPSSMPLGERMYLLNRLAIWALLKGPVSIEMTTEVLKEEPDSTKALIERYSKWFNTPEPGKYVLYHDRLRTYLLQKLSDFEINELNEILIEFLESALEKVDGSEAELYALEYLSSHMAVESKLGNKYERLNDFANQETLWSRQVTISKEYKWSQQAVQHSIKEGARRHHEMNTLSSTVNSVKLMQEEENSANQIMNLLNEGDYTTALKRALFFSGEKLITINLLMINELLINEKQPDVYKLKVYKEIIEIIKKSDVKQTDFPVILIYNFYLEFKRLSLDYYVLFEKCRFDYHDILYLLEFDEIDIIEIEYLVKHTNIHFSSHPDIYIAIAKFYLDKNNKTKTIYYLEKSLDNINRIPVSYGQYYNFDSIDREDLNDRDYYRTLIRWKLLIAFIYYDIEQYSSAKKILNEILLLSEKFSNEIEEKLINDLTTISSSAWFDIFSLCFLLEKYDYVINSKWFKLFISIPHRYFDTQNQLDTPSLLRVLLIQKNYIQFKNFNKFLKDNEYERKIICEMDYLLLLCSLDKLDEAGRYEYQIIEEIYSLQFGAVKFNAIIYFIEILYKVENFVMARDELIEDMIELFFSQLKELNNQNSNYYYGLVIDLIKTCFKQNKNEKALKIYNTCLLEINEKNIENSKQKYDFLNIFFKSLFSYNYLNPDFLIAKLKEIGSSKTYYDIYEMVYLDFISRGFIDEAIIFANQYNIKNNSLPKRDCYFVRDGVVLETKLSSDIKNIPSKTYEFISTSDYRIYNS